LALPDYSYCKAKAEEQNVDVASLTINLVRQLAFHSVRGMISTHISFLPSQLQQDDIAAAGWELSEKLGEVTMAIP
jgi:hypothetical protein